MMFRTSRRAETDYRVEVSQRIKEEFNNGGEYYAMHGKQINLPRLEHN